MSVLGFGPPVDLAFRHGVEHVIDRRGRSAGLTIHPLTNPPMPKIGQLAVAIEHDRDGPPARFREDARLPNSAKPRWAARSTNSRKIVTAKRLRLVVKRLFGLVTSETPDASSSETVEIARSLVVDACRRARGKVASGVSN